jgi:hypothetical protein
MTCVMHKARAAKAAADPLIPAFRTSFQSRPSIAPNPLNNSTSSSVVQYMGRVPEVARYDQFDRQ